MTKQSPLNTLALASIAIFAITLLSFGWPGRAQAAGPHIDLYIMASQITGSQWCTGSYNPPIHSPNWSIDVFGDGSGSVCLGDNSSTSRLRAWGFGGSSSHVTMNVYPAGGSVSGACDIVNLGMIDVQGGLHGELSWYHTSRTAPTGVSLPLSAGPYPGQQRTRTVGATTADNDGCGWTAYHVHQGTLVSCMTVNGSLGATSAGNVWDIDRYIEEIDYSEGLSLCDG